MLKKTLSFLRPFAGIALLTIAVSMWLRAQGGYEAAAAPAPAPDFTLNDVQGKPVSLASHRGHPVLLNFWATWCPPCRAELPDLEKISKEKSHCISVLGVSEGDDSPKQLADFAKEHGLSYPLLIDSANVGGQYGVHTLPHSVLLDAEGNAVGTFDGPINPADLEKALSALPDSNC